MRSPGATDFGAGVCVGAVLGADGALVLGAEGAPGFGVAEVLGCTPDAARARLSRARRRLEAALCEPGPSAPAPISLRAERNPHEHTTR